jgi:hypothetical protein
MRKIPIYLTTGVCCLLFQSAQATQFMQEGFNYSAGSLATVGNPPWNVGTGNANIAVTAGNLTYTGLADPGGNDLTVTSGVAAGSIGAAFNASPITAGTVYYSFLAQCTTLPTANQYLTSLLASGTPNGSADALGLYVGQQTAGSTFRVGIRHNGSGATYTTGAWATANTVNLFVVGYTFVDGTANDLVSLWVNPTPGDSQPVANVSFVGGGADATGLQNIGFKAQSAATAGNWIFDTLRVGDTWADVVTPVPEPSTSALAGLAALGLAAWRRVRR